MTTGPIGNDPSHEDLERPKGSPAQASAFLISLDRIVVPALILNLDLSIEHYNEAFERATGLSPLERGSMDFRRVVHPDDLAAHLDQNERLLSGQMDRYKTEGRFVSATGGFFRGALSVQLECSVGGTPLYFIVMIEDISSAKQLEEALRESCERLGAILDSVQTGILVIDPETHTIIDANPAMSKLAQASKEELIGRVCRGFICNADSGTCPVSGGGKKSENVECVLVDTEGKIVPVVRNVVTVKYDGRDRLLESLMDISEFRRLEDELRNLATLDPLTGLNNRRYYMELTEREVSRSLRYGSPMAVAVFDIDHFEQINDAFGHAVGDRLLTELARSLREQLRQNDIAGRIGGEEFAVTFIACDLENATNATERLRKNMERITVMVNDRRLKFTLSAGVTRLWGMAHDVDSLLRYADRALHAAKSKGRHRVEVYPPIQLQP